MSMCVRLSAFLTSAGLNTEKQTLSNPGDETGDATDQRRRADMWLLSRKPLRVLFLSPWRLMVLQVSATAYNKLLVLAREPYDMSPDLGISGFRNPLLVQNLLLQFLLPTGGRAKARMRPISSFLRPTSQALIMHFCIPSCGARDGVLSEERYEQRPPCFRHGHLLPSPVRPVFGPPHGCHFFSHRVPIIVCARV